MKTILQTHINEKQLVSNKYLEMRQAYQLLDNEHQKQKEELNLKIEMFSVSDNKLKLQENLKDNLQKELDILKKQMSEYIKDIKNITLEKDNEIAFLDQKLKSLEENKKQNIENISIKKINNNQNTIILGRSRGINTTLKRGMQASNAPGVRPS